MRLFLTIVIVTLILSGCKKDIGVSQNQGQAPDDKNLAQVKLFLKKSLTTSRFQELNWSSVRHYIHGRSNEIYAVPSNSNTSGQVAYVVIEKDSIKGNWVELVKVSLNKTTSIINTSFDEKTRRVILTDPKGYISNIDYYRNGEKQQPLGTNYRLSSQVMSVPAMMSMAVPGPSGLSYHEMVLVQALVAPNFNSGINPGENAEYILPADNSTTNGGYSGGFETQIYEVEFDDPSIKPSVDIQKIFKCFDNIPDDGATYSLTLCSDVPVNVEPLVAVKGTNPGHAFLILKKENQGQVVTQAYGFYPTTSWKGFVPFTDSKIVNDQMHEINASITINNLTRADFNLIKINSINLSAMKYDLSTFNCTDYALQIFNQVATNPISLRPILVDFEATIPLVNVVINNSPQSLFEQLKLMKDLNLNAGNPINIDQSRNYSAPLSHGECF